jgi:predicted nucleotidyltransferase
MNGFVLREIMRLSREEVAAIKKCFRNVFGSGKVFLFGSRVDDTKKGGDVDLYIVPEKKESFYDKKLKFLVALKKIIGEQKIDVIIAKDPNRLIEKEALKNGVEL